MGFEGGGGKSDNNNNTILLKNAIIIPSFIELMDTANAVGYNGDPFHLPLGVIYDDFLYLPHRVNEWRKKCGAVTLFGGRRWRRWAPGREGEGEGKKGGGK